MASLQRVRSDMQRAERVMTSPQIAGIVMERATGVSASKEKVVNDRVEVRSKKRHQNIELRKSLGLCQGQSSRWDFVGTWYGWGW
jgi:hypothetical protein